MTSLAAVFDAREPVEMPTVEDLRSWLREDPEAEQQLATLREQFIAFAGPASDGARALTALFERVAEALPGFTPAPTPNGMFDQMMAGLFDMAMLVAPWWQKQPEAVARAGLVVPLSQMPPVEIGALLRTHRDGGDDATVAFVRTYYDRLFACPHFLPRLKDEWRADAFLRRRIVPLAQALDAHAAGLFAASIPTLLAQFEGLIADLVEHKGRMKEDQWGVRT